MSHEPVIVMLDDIDHTPDNQLGNIEGLVWFVLAFIFVCFVTAFIGSFMASNNNTIPTIVTTPKGYAPLNSSGIQLANLAAWHQQRIGQMGLLAIPPEGATSQPLGMPANPTAVSQRVWVSEPPGSVPFDEQGGISLGAPQPGVDIPVVTMTVPYGFDGVIKYIANAPTDPAFVDFSGDLIWRILINGRPVRNFANILARKGTMAQGRIISPIRIFSGDIVQYTVQFAAGALTGQVVCSLNGYLYPSKGIS